jgi:hypothetical protein
MDRKKASINPARIKRGAAFVAFLRRGGKHRDDRRPNRGTARARLHKEMEQS